MLFFIIFFSSKSSTALEVHPGVGAFVRYSDNIQLAPDDEVSEIVYGGLVKADVAETEGPLVYGVNASLRKEIYNSDTYNDVHYFNLGANADWELLEKRLVWYTRDNYYQRLVDTIEADTPDNLEDTNVFITGANIILPISGRQEIRITPEYSQYYYSESITDNRQYSLLMSWNYQAYRSINFGLYLNGQKIKYDDELIADTTFINAGFLMSGERAYSSYTVRLGTTAVERSEATGINGISNSSNNRGFSGDVEYDMALSNRSSIVARVLTEITDTSRVSQVDAVGSPSDVQLTTDVIRNSVIGLTYTRRDEVMQTAIRGGYQKIKHSDNTDLDSLIQTFALNLDFPVTQVMTSGVFLTFSNVKRVENSIEEKHFIVGVNVNTSFSARLKGSVNVKYRTKESTDSQKNYDEFGVIVALNYGY